MKKKSNSQSAFLNLRVFIGLFIALAGVFLALLGAGAFSSATAQSPSQNPGSQSNVLPVAHPRHIALPWDPTTSPIAKPLVESPQLNVSLSTTTWTALGPAPILNGQRPGNGPVSGRVAGIAAHPTDANTIYEAAAGGGVWKTTNGGTTWNMLTDSQSTLSMGAIAIAPSNPSVIYAGTGEANNSIDSNFGRGVLVSTDGGATWTLRNNRGVFDRRTMSEIAVDPGDASIAYIAVAALGVNGVLGNTGIWKTTDGGTTWTNTTTTITSIQSWSSVRIDPNTPATLYAAVGDSDGAPDNGVYKSTDGGTSYSLLAGAPSGTATGRIVVAVAKSNSQVVYVSASNPSGDLFKFMRSDNGGSTWTDLTTGTPNYMGGQGDYDTTLIVDPTNSAIVYAGGGGGPDPKNYGANSILRSTTSGTSWTDISNTGSPSTGPHVDHHAAVFDANGKYLDGDDGGIYRLDDPATITWTQLNGNLNTIQFQGIGLHPTNANIALGGSQDNGTSMYTGSLGWTLVEDGDGGFVKFSKTNTNRVYHQIPVASAGSSDFFRRSDDGGTTWAGKTNGITDNTESLQNFYAPFVVDPGNGDRVLYGARHVWETTNGGDVWSALGSAFADNVDAIGLAPSDANTIYASTGESTFVSTNHGATWTQHDLPVAGTVQDIQVNPTNPLTAYAVISNFTDGGNVFQTTDGGVTWTNISGNLPSLPVYSLQIDSTTPDRLFVGNEDGVYVTINGGTTWARFGDSLPNAQVFQIELNTSLGILAAATHGRGTWEITPNATATPTATPTASPTPTATATPTATTTPTPRPVPSPRPRPTPPPRP